MAGSRTAVDATPPRTLAPQDLCGGGARGVLDGAFAVLEALSHAQHGLGLSGLAHASGLAKTSAYRLAEQLTAVDAVQRVGQHYFIGPKIGHLGHCWQPDPLLRQACEDPISRLSVRTGATAGVYVLYGQRAMLVTATAPIGQSWVPACEFDAESTPHTAAGRVLLAADPHAARPAAVPEAAWALWRAGIRGERFAITESDRAPEGCCVAAAPIWRAGGNCAGAAAVLPRAAAPSRAVIDMLLQTARRISQSF